MYVRTMTCSPKLDTANDSVSPYIVYRLLLCEYSQSNDTRSHWLSVRITKKSHGIEFHILLYVGLHRYE